MWALMEGRSQTQVQTTPTTTVKALLTTPMVDQVPPLRCSRPSALPPRCITRQQITANVHLQTWKFQTKAVWQKAFTARTTPSALSTSRATCNHHTLSKALQTTRNRVTMPTDPSHQRTRIQNRSTAKMQTRFLHRAKLVQIWWRVWGRLGGRILKSVRVWTTLFQRSTLPYSNK